MKKKENDFSFSSHFKALNTTVLVILLAWLRPSIRNSELQFKFDFLGNTFTPDLSSITGLKLDSC